MAREERGYTTQTGNWSRLFTENRVFKDEKGGGLERKP